MTPLTAEKIAELERLLASARVLPWENGEGDPASILCTADYACVAQTNAAFTDATDNARLIVAAVNAIPSLLSLAKRVAGAPVACHRTYTGKADQAKWSWIDGPASLGAVDQARLYGWRIENAYLVEIVGGEHNGDNQ